MLCGPLSRRSEHKAHTRSVCLPGGQVLHMGSDTQKAPEASVLPETPFQGPLCIRGAGVCAGAAQMPGGLCLVWGLRSGVSMPEPWLGIVLGERTALASSVCSSGPGTDLA